MDGEIACRFHETGMIVIHNRATVFSRDSDGPVRAVHITNQDLVEILDRAEHSLQMPLRIERINDNRYMIHGFFLYLKVNDGFPERTHFPFVPSVATEWQAMACQPEAISRVFVESEKECLPTRRIAESLGLRGPKDILVIEMMANRQIAFNQFASRRHDTKMAGYLAQ